MAENQADCENHSKNPNDPTPGQHQEDRVEDVILLLHLQASDMQQWLELCRGVEIVAFQPKQDIRWKGGRPDDALNEIAHVARAEPYTRAGQADLHHEKQ